jgi:aromatic ring-cleaving dioxygenase
VHTQALFIPEFDVKTVRVSARLLGPDKEDMRQLHFHDVKGAELPKWKHTNGGLYESVMQVAFPSVPNSWAGHNIWMPEGHVVIGVAAVTDIHGYIKWIDLKTWKPY